MCFPISTTADPLNFQSNSSPIILSKVENPREGRLSQIDGLRAIAALSVVAFHFTTQFDYYFIHATDLRIAFPKGHFGVNLFFVISGFVICMTVDKILRPMDFMVSRFSRLFPTYWVAVCLTFGIIFLSGMSGYGSSVKDAAINLSMLQSFFSVKDVDGVYWSLQIELLFYVWMLLIWVSGKFGKILFIVGGWVLVAFFSACAEAFFKFSLPYTVSHFLLLTWIPWFGMGIAAFLSFRDARFGTIHAVVVLLSLSAILIRTSLIETIIGVLSFLAVMLACRGRCVFLEQRLLVFFGVISYPLYLLHEKIGWITMLKLEERNVTPWVAIALALICSVSLATLLHWIVELPASNAIRKIYRKGPARSAERDFSKLRWTFGGGAVLCALAVSFAYTSHAKKAAKDLQYTLNTNLPRPPDERPCNVEIKTQEIIIILGQSNAASHAETSGQSAFSPVFYDGKCYLTREPLPGTTGSGGNIWSSLLPQLQMVIPNKTFVLAPLAVGNTRIQDWVKSGGELHSRLLEHLQLVKSSHLKVSAIIWQQGEADAIAGTAAADYKRDLMTLRQIINAAGLNAPVFIAKSTYCHGVSSPAIHRAIEAAIIIDRSLMAGADTDTLGKEFRYDDCHFSQLGAVQAAGLWSVRLANYWKNEAREVP